MPEFPRGGFDNEVPRGEKKLPCALVIDTSGSLSSYADELRNGVIRLVSELQNDMATAATVEIMLITFDDEVRILHPFTNIRELNVPHLDMGGTTHIFDALEVAYSEIRTRQEQYALAGSNSYAPFLVILTDGRPVKDSDENGIVTKIRLRNAAKKIVPYPFAIGNNADEALLKRLRVDGKAFRVDMKDIGSIFEFLSVSLSSIAADTTVVRFPLQFSII